MGDLYKNTLTFVLLHFGPRETGCSAVDRCNGHCGQTFCCSSFALHMCKTVVPFKYTYLGAVLFMKLPSPHSVSCYFIPCCVLLAL